MYNMSSLEPGACLLQMEILQISKPTLRWSLPHGTQRHIHSIPNFSGNVVSPRILDILRATFTGETDMTTECNITWYALQTTVTMAVP